MYDAIVVGARCVGAPLTMLLAGQGARVLLVDRATFPSDIPHGHVIHRHVIDPQSFFSPENMQRLMRPAPFEAT